MLLIDEGPRYLPHQDSPEVLSMRLSPLGDGPWIEPDSDLSRFHRHKLAQREQLGERVYRAADASLPAQRELAGMLLEHLLDAHPDVYRRQGEQLRCLVAEPEAFTCAVEDAAEPLWAASLWVADDLVLMEPRGESYALTAASLCSASGWRLEDKFLGSLASLHGDIPGFTAQLLPRVERFFHHLKTSQLVVRINWGVQAGTQLNMRDTPPTGQVAPDAALYYRVERQCLRRLPRSGAIVFSIRVYLHPLEQLVARGDALASLLRAIDATPASLALYKGFVRLAPALDVWRRRVAG